MALKDVLPDRPLSFDEFQSIQAQDAFDQVLTQDTPGDIDVLFCVQGDKEYHLHYSEDAGWHHHSHDH